MTQDDVDGSFKDQNMNTIIYMWKHSIYYQNLKNGTKQAKQASNQVDRHSVL